MLAIMLLFTGCTLFEPGPCEVPERLVCDGCLSGYWSCSYEGYEVMSGSCNGPCWPHAELFREVCDQGLSPTWEEYDAEVECVDLGWDTGVE